MDKSDKIFITGASGQLGRRLIRELLTRGYENLRAQYRSEEKADKYCPENVERCYGDITESGWMTEALEGCYAVIHCAARVSVRPLNHENAAQMYRVNVEGTRNIIEACRKIGIKRLLHVSSVAGLGASVDGVPVDETVPYNLDGFGYPYFDTKHESEMLVLAANSDTLETIVVNPSIMISPPDRPVTESDLRKIPKRIPAYFDFGLNLVETGDVIDGMIKALEHGKSGERYLLTGENIDPKKVFAIGKKYFGIKKPFVKIPLPLMSFFGFLAEVFYLCKGKKPKLNRTIGRLAKLKFFYTCEKAQRDLGYNPRPLEQSIEDILAGLKHQDSAKQ